MGKETVVNKRVTTTKRPSAKTGKLETVKKQTTKTMLVSPSDKKEKPKKASKPTKENSKGEKIVKELLDTPRPEKKDKKKQAKITKKDSDYIN